jgi:hypothetical protein
MIQRVMSEQITDSPTTAQEDEAAEPLKKPPKQRAKRRTTKKRRPARQSTKTKVLPTPRISFAKQLDILRAYAAEGDKPVTNDQVAALVKIAASTASLANPFFADIGLVDRIDGKYQASPAVQSFARAHRWDPENAPRELAPVLIETWFAKRLLPRLAYSAMSEREATAELDQEAKAGPEYLPQLRVLLDFLEASGLIHRDGGRVEPGDADTHVPQMAPTEPEPQEPEFRPSPPASTGRHPLIEGLLLQLPDEGGSWTSKERDQWLALAKLTVEMLYELEGSQEAPEEPAMPHRAGPAVP